MSVLLETALGDLVIDLFVKERPRCSLNFLKLCKLKYYNWSLFDSIEPDFVAKCGIPASENSSFSKSGESVYKFLYGDQAEYFEVETMPKINHTKRGLVSMVNNGKDLHGSQFFITLADGLDYLDGVHTVFGEVAEGLETLDKLNSVICDERHRPYQDIRIGHTLVIQDPFDDPPGLQVPSRSPSPTPELLKDARLNPGDEVDDDAKLAPEKIRERIEAKEAKARAHVLEMIGDLHHAEEKPPDNVLFVCKLNPVTTEDDLNIIFSRFGKIKEAEIIRDRKTGNSLQYAFIEFFEPKHCENAYFKMDNVLIDDRRIHVDFSQSVSKNYQWKKQLVNEPERSDANPRTQNRDFREKRSNSRNSKSIKRPHSRSPIEKLGGSRVREHWRGNIARQSRDRSFNESRCRETADSSRRSEHNNEQFRDREHSRINEYRKLESASTSSRSKSGHDYVISEKRVDEKDRNENSNRSRDRTFHREQDREHPRSISRERKYRRERRSSSSHYRDKTGISSMNESDKSVGIYRNRRDNNDADFRNRSNIHSERNGHSFKNDKRKCDNTDDEVCSSASESENDEYSKLTKHSHLKKKKSKKSNKKKAKKVKKKKKKKRSSSSEPNSSCSDM